MLKRLFSGRVRNTMVDTQGRCETNDFLPGDIWYFTRGHGHMLQCLGNTPCSSILVFGDGHFVFPKDDVFINAD